MRLVNKAFVILAVTAALLLSPSPADAGTYIQAIGATFDPFNASRSVTLGTTTVTGRMIYGVAFFTTGGTLTCTDNAGSSFTTVYAPTADKAVCAAYNITGTASHTVTFAISPSESNEGTIVAVEYSGVATSAAFDQSCAAASFVTDITCTTGTTTQATELVVGAYRGNNVPTAGSGFVIQFTKDNVRIEDKSVSSTGTQVINFIHAEANAKLIGTTFKDAGGAASPARRRIIQ